LSIAAKKVTEEQSGISARGREEIAGSIMTDKREPNEGRALIERRWIKQGARAHQAKVTRGYWAELSDTEKKERLKNLHESRRRRAAMAKEDHPELGNEALWTLTLVGGDKQIAAKIPTSIVKKILSLIPEDGREE
jgi:hypothetical protein